jgi:penicillin-binding protein 2
VLGWAIIAPLSFSGTGFILAKSRPIKDIYLEYRIFSGRLVLVLVGAVVLSLLLAGRLAWLQIHSHSHYSNLALENRVRLSPIPPGRGLIYDRGGNLLAENLPSFSLEITPEAVEDLDDLLQELVKVVAVTEEDILQFRQNLARTPPFASVPLRLNLDEEEVAAFEEMRYRFTGAAIEARLKRHYPHDELFAHVLGYVGRINEQELRNLDEAEYRGTTHIGKLGVEKYYESQLHGTNGVLQQEVNSKGRPIRVLEEKPSQAGDSLILTLDLKLQQAAREALGEESGSIVAIDPRNGEVLAMVSTPAYDPNLFVTGISSKDYQFLRDHPERPLYDRALKGQYPPGSTIKPVIALAGLEFKKTNPWRSINDPGYFQLPNEPRKYRDWKRGGHGKVDMNKAIAQSCDTYFYDLALRLGIDEMHAMASRFRLGVVTGIDLPGEAAGLMPSRDWKRKRFRQPWYPGETLIVGIGQGYMLSTPLQLASVAGCIGMRGRCQQPHLLKSRLDASGGESQSPVSGWTVPVNDTSYWDNIIGGMISVMHDQGGTGRRSAEGASYRIAGKTGTAQVFGLGEEESYDAEKLDRKLRDHALFIAFAPAENPRIAVAVIVEHAGSGGSNAAPLARKVMDAWLVKAQKPKESEGGQADAG